METGVWTWNEAMVGYRAVEEVLAENGAQEGEGIITANSPGYAVVTGRPSYNVPNGGVETILQLAKYYGVRWVLVEDSHPDALEDLYEDPHDVGALEYLGTVEQIHVFVIEE